jgi:molybdenum cofactor biosynthesis enzyme MoaA
MVKIRANKAFSMTWRGIKNLLRKKPQSVSLEITHSCNSRCQHCDKGSIIRNEYQASPERFAAHIRFLIPRVALFSRGEPFLRKYVYKIVRLLFLINIIPFLKTTVPYRIVNRVIGHWLLIRTVS